MKLCRLFRACSFVGLRVPLLEHAIADCTLLGERHRRPEKC